MAENIINLFDKNQQLLQQLLNDEDIFEFNPSDPENMKNKFLLDQIVDNLDGDAFSYEYIVSEECLNSVYLREIQEIQQEGEQKQRNYADIQRGFEDIQLDYDDLQQEDEQIQLEFEEIQQEDVEIKQDNIELQLKENEVPQLKSKKVKLLIQEVDRTKLSSKVVENEILKQQLEDEKIDWSKLSTKVRKNRFVSCSHCGKQFKSLSPLAKHEMVNHPKCAITKPFYCDLCGINFRFKAYLKNHIKKVHVRDYKYQCNICSFKMYAKTQYTNHMKGHDPKAEKQFSCNICDKRFDRKENLLVHHRMHVSTMYNMTTPLTNICPILDW